MIPCFLPWIDNQVTYNKTQASLLPHIFGQVQMLTLTNMGMFKLQRPCKTSLLICLLSQMPRVHAQPYFFGHHTVPAVSVQKEAAESPSAKWESWFYADTGLAKDKPLSTAQQSIKLLRLQLQIKLGRTVQTRESKGHATEKASLEPRASCGAWPSPQTNARVGDTADAAQVRELAG